MDHENDRPSKSARKREMLALQRLGEALIELSPQQLDQFDLPPRLRDAIVAARRMSKRGALYRQRQYIGRLMREADAEAIRAALEQVTARDRAYGARHATAERWRLRLVEAADTGIEEFLAAHPQIDRQHLRRLVREARREAAAGISSARARELFRYLLEQLDR